MDLLKEKDRSIFGLCPGIPKCLLCHGGYGKCCGGIGENCRQHGIGEGFGKREYKLCQLSVTFF